MMREPDNRSGWSDQDGDLWVRVDGLAARGNWWCLCIGPKWEDYGQGSVTPPRTWGEIGESGVALVERCDEETTAAAVERVLEAVA